MSRKLAMPRLYSVELTLKNGRVINKMLGVAFNIAQRQQYYDMYRNYRHWRSSWNDSTLEKVEFRSEKLEEGLNA